MVLDPNNRPSGDGGNWNLEASRFPQAWNLLGAIKRRNARVDTVIIDNGFAEHDDLPGLDIPQLCKPSGTATLCTFNQPELHGTLVTGIAGANFGTTAPSGFVRGIVGTNPVARLHVGPLPEFPRHERNANNRPGGIRADPDPEPGPGRGRRRAPA